MSSAIASAQAWHSAGEAKRAGRGRSDAVRSFKGLREPQEPAPSSAAVVVGASKGLKAAGGLLVRLALDKLSTSAAICCRCNAAAAKPRPPRLWRALFGLAMN
jgi:hypothetical protein